MLLVGGAWKYFASVKNNENLLIKDSIYIFAKNIFLPKIQF